MKIEFIFGIVILVLLIAGGALGTLSNIRGTRGPRERRFVIRACMGAWALFLSLVALVILLPSPYRWIAGILFFVLIPAMIYRWATRHQLIRILEEREKGAGDGAGKAASEAADQRPG